MEKSSPERRGFSSLLSRLILRRLMSGARTSRPEFACEENQRRSDQAGAAQQPEAIEGCQERRLLIQDPAELRVRVDRCVGHRKTMPRKMRGQVCQKPPGNAGSAEWHERQERNDGIGCGAPPPWLQTRCQSSLLDCGIGLSGWKPCCSSLSAERNTRVGSRE